MIEPRYCIQKEPPRYAGLCIFRIIDIESVEHGDLLIVTNMTYVEYDFSVTYLFVAELCAQPQMRRVISHKHNHSVMFSSVKV